MFEILFVFFREIIERKTIGMPPILDKQFMLVLDSKSQIMASRIETKKLT